MTLSQDSLAEDRSMNSDSPTKFMRGYRAGLRHDRRNADTDGHMRRLMSRSDFAQAAGYLEGLAAANARKPEVIEAMRRWNRRDAGPGQPPKHREVQPELEGAA